MSVTNEGRTITTTTSGHMAMSGPPDINLPVALSPPMPHSNFADTSSAVEHSGRTQFGGGWVVGLGDAIEPSLPAHGDIGLGGGVGSHTYQKEARAMNGSSTVRVEGKPPARTDDPTTQNHANTTGTFVRDKRSTALDAHAAHALEACRIEEKSVTIQCSHKEATNEKKEIEIWRGDTITVKATRKNGKEPDAGPACSKPPHMKWKVTRSGGVNMFGSPLDTKTEEKFGDTLVLGSDWTVPLVSTDTSAKEDPKRRSMRIAFASVKQGQTLAQFLAAWKADENPLHIHIVGWACSGSVTRDVRCYPRSKYKFDIPLDWLRKIRDWLNSAWNLVQNVASMCGSSAKMTLKAPGDSLEAALEFQWKEDDGYEISREAELSVSGLLWEWTLKGEFSLTDLLKLIPYAGPFLAGAVSKALKYLDIALLVGAWIEVTAKCSGSISWKWSREGGFSFSFGGAAIKVPVEIIFKLFVKLELTTSVYAMAGVQIEGEPDIQVEYSAEKGVCLGIGDFDIAASVFVTVHVGIDLTRVAVKAPGFIGKGLGWLASRLPESWQKIEMKDISETFRPESWKMHFDEHKLVLGNLFT